MVERVLVRLTNVRSKAVALYRLLRTSDADFAAFMNTYDTLFTDSPENTRADRENGVPMQGYRMGSSPELAQYYKLIHLMCTLGSVEKMYLPPVLDVERSVSENQELFERQLARDLGVGPGQTVLDLGCGCGAIASNIADQTGATVYGVNIEPSQIEKAWENPNRAQLHFSVADFNEPLAFGHEMFDAVYNVQALTYATDLEATFKEVYRVLKPGGKLIVNDVAALDDYDRSNDHHRLLIQHTRELTAFGGLWHAKYWEGAFESAGFEVVFSEGRSALEMIKKERALYDRFNEVAGALSRMRLIPKKVDTMLQRMNTNCASYIEAEELGLITLNWYFVAQKPFARA